MDEQHAITTPDAAGDDFSRTLREGRSRVHQFVRDYSRQLAEIEARLEAELAQAQAALRQVDESRQDAAARPTDWEAQNERLAQLLERLATERDEHAQRLECLRGDRQSLVDDFVARQAALDRRGDDLAARESALADRERELHRRQAEHEAERGDLAERARRLEARGQEVEREHAELIAGRDRLAEQRRRVAEEFRERRAADFSELERRRQDLDRRSAAQQEQFEQAAAAARQEREALDQQLRQARAERDARRHELTEIQRRHDALEQKLRALGASHDDLRQQVTDRQVKLAAAEQRIREAEDHSSDLLRQLAVANRRGDASAEQHAESDQALAQLTAQLTQARDQAACAQSELQSAQAETARLWAEAAALRDQVASGGGGAEESSELNRRIAEQERDIQRLEAELTAAEERATHAAPDPDRSNLESRLGMALDDLRAEKARNGELQRKLLASAQSAPASSGGGMDWESQKRRMLAALEADGDGDAAPERAAERLKIEETIRHTDVALAEKDSEIGELKRLLEEQTGNWGNMAVGAAAVAEVLDKDEIVRQERDNLQQLQDEWREKLRQAEVDISVERAKLARDRADLEERLRHLEESHPRAAEGKGGAKAAAEKPQRGRWLARLGLKDQAEE